jgi:hypothetical protein
VAGLRNSAQTEPQGFRKEFALAAASLVQKPGRLSLNLSARDGATVEELAEMLLSGTEPAGSKITYKIKAN